jgi:EmrB/QacA subfamily drug resistance transporter
MSSPQRPVGPGDAPQPHPERWRALAVTLMVGFMSLLDVTIVNVAVPSIQQGLGASSESVQWVVSGYALTFGLTLVAGGRLGDVVGRRRMFLVGLVAFTVTSAAAGLAPDARLLVVARLLQGAAAGFLTPQNTGLIQQLFTGAERGRAFGVFGTTVGLSAATGPVIGGLILEAAGADDGWRYVFFVNVPIGLLAMLLAARLLPKAGPRTGAGVRSQIDGLGAVLLGLAVLCVLLPIVEAMGDPATPLWFVVLLAPVAGWAFVRHERAVVRRGGSPLLDVRLFGQAPGFASGIVLGSTYFCGFSGIWLVLALYLQDGLGFTPLQSGLTVTPFAIGSALASVLAGRVIARLGRRVTVFGLSLVVLGFAATAVAVPLTSPSHPALWLVLPLLVAGVGSGSTISPNITMTLASVPPRMGGAAGGALQTGQRIGSAVGAAVLAAAFRLTLAHGGGLGAAVCVAFLCALGFSLVALAMALRELRIRPTLGEAAPAEGQEARPSRR